MPGEAYNQQHYQENNRNSNLATQNSGYNSKLVGMGSERSNDQSILRQPDAAGAGFGLDLNARYVQLGGAMQFIETERGKEVFYTLKGGAYNGFSSSISGGPSIDLFWKTERGRNLLALDMLKGESKYWSGGYLIFVTYSEVYDNKGNAIMMGLNFTLGVGFGAGKQHTW